MSSTLSIKELPQYEETELGASSWLTVTQAMVDQFAELGGDHQWIHTDPVKAADSQFEGTIVHGYFILAFTPQLMDQVFTVADAKMGVNRGFNKLRFIAPLKVGGRLRLKVEVQSVESSDKYTDVLYLLTYEGEGMHKPVCVAELLKRWY